MKTLKIEDLSKNFGSTEVLKKCNDIGIEFEYVVLHPIPNPPIPDNGPNAYLEKIPREVLSQVKKNLAN